MWGASQGGSGEQNERRVSQWERRLNGVWERRPKQRQRRQKTAGYAVTVGSYVAV